MSQQQPHVLQLHDWHAAAASMLYWDVYNPNGYQRTRVMLTIHNLDNTGGQAGASQRNRQGMEVAVVGSSCKSRSDARLWLCVCGGLVLTPTML